MLLHGLVPAQEPGPREANPMLPFQAAWGMELTAALHGGSARSSVAIEVVLAPVLFVRSAMGLAAPHGSDHRQDCF